MTTSWRMVVWKKRRPGQNSDRYSKKSKGRWTVRKNSLPRFLLFIFIHSLIRGTIDYYSESLPSQSWTKKKDFRVEHMLLPPLIVSSNHNLQTSKSTGHQLILEDLGMLSFMVFASLLWFISFSFCNHKQFLCLICFQTFSITVVCIKFVQFVKLYTNAKKEQISVISWMMLHNTVFHRW